MVKELGEQAIEVQAICTSAYMIWDAENPDDTATAKRGCNGTKPSRDSYGTPPCPLREFCLETALEINAAHGVWGGMSLYERKQILKAREDSKPTSQRLTDGFELEN